MADSAPVDPAQAVHDTRQWLQRAVIGLNLCPFAKAVHVKGQIHYAVSAACSASELLLDLKNELNRLLAPVFIDYDTTLLIAPNCLPEFLDFNDLLGQADRLLRKMRLDGVIQLASFHPQYQFAGKAADDITNHTNRAPYPTLHLLKEVSVARAVQAVPEAADIFEANMRTMDALGHAGWAALDVGAHPAVDALPEQGRGNIGA